MEGSSTHMLSQVHIHPVIREQQMHYLHVPVQRCQEQRSAAILRASVNKGIVEGNAKLLPNPAHLLPYWGKRAMLGRCCCFLCRLQHAVVSTSTVSRVREGGERGAETHEVTLSDLFISIRSADSKSSTKEQFGDSSELTAWNKAVLFHCNQKA